MNNCCICFDDIQEKDSYVLSCNHEFHDTCIMKWFESGDNFTCPLCRQSIKDNGDIHKIFSSAGDIKCFIVMNS